MLSDDEIAAIELGGKKFMQKLKEVDMSRDYTIIVDASGSMFSGTNWAVSTYLDFISRLSAMRPLSSYSLGS